MHISPTPMRDHAEFWRQRPRYHACAHCQDDHGPNYYCDERYEAEMSAHQMEMTAWPA